MSRSGRGSAVAVMFTIMLSSAALALSPAALEPQENVAAADYTRWLYVPAWRGTFASQLRWQVDRDVMRVDFDVDVEGSASGDFLLAGAAGRWTGDGQASWSYRDFHEIGLGSLRFGATTHGAGTTRIDADTELSIDVTDGTYTLFVYPGGFDHGGLELELVAHSNAGRESSRGTAASLDTRPGGVGGVAFRMPLPAFGTHLCGTLSVWSDEWFVEIFSWNLSPVDGQEDPHPAAGSHLCLGVHAEVDLPLDIAAAAGALASAYHGPAPARPRAASAAIVAPSTSIRLFFVALGDAGRLGKRVGCGDSLVPVEPEDRAPGGAGADGLIALLGQLAGGAGGNPRAERPSELDLLDEALEQLLEHGRSSYRDTGLHDALHRSDLGVDRVRTVSGGVRVDLTGELHVADSCAAARILGQLTETALQFPSFGSVTFFVDGVPLERLLSGVTR